MTTKREARIIMELPDGYDYEFINGGKFVIGASPDKAVIAFRIDNGKVVPLKIEWKDNAPKMPVLSRSFTAMGEKG